jgi:hypothetical protein
MGAEDATYLINSLENNNRLKTLNLTSNSSISDEGWALVLYNVFCNLSVKAQAFPKE